MCAKTLQSCPTLCKPMDCSPPGTSVHRDSPGKYIGVDHHALLQGIFLTQGSNPCLLCLLNWQVGSLPVGLYGKPFSSVQSLSHVRFFVTPWIAAQQASLYITNSWSSLRLIPIELVMPSSHLILCRPLLLLPPILPASGCFPMSQLFAWGGQSTGVSASASFLPKNTQGWSPLEGTGWISLQSKGLSRVFSNTTVQKHQFFGT